MFLFDNSSNFLFWFLPLKVVSKKLCGFGSMVSVSQGNKSGEKVEEKQKLFRNPVAIKIILKSAAVL